MIADDFFGVALGVDIGGIDEVAALVEIAVEHLFRFRFAGAEAPVFAEGHGAEAEGAHAESAVSERNVMVEWHTNLSVTTLQESPPASMRSFSPHANCYNITFAPQYRCIGG